MYHPVLLHTIQHRIQDDERSRASDTSAAVYEKWAGIILGVCLTNSTSEVDEGHATGGDTMVWPGGVVEQGHFKDRGRAEGGLRRVGRAYSIYQWLIVCKCVQQWYMFDTIVIIMLSTLHLCNEVFLGALYVHSTPNRFS